MKSIPAVTEIPTPRGDYGLSDLEGAADAILASRGALGHRAGAYTGRQLGRKIRLEQDKWPEVDEIGVPSEVVDYLVERQIDELVDLARLSAMQEICFRLHAVGLSSRKIAATLRLGHQTVATHLRVAKRRVRAAHSEGRYAGWYEVYLSEVNRPAYRPRRNRR